MPSWGAVLDELSATSNPLDQMRRKYLRIMHEYTGRNIIAYYSSFIQNLLWKETRLMRTIKMHLCKPFVVLIVQKDWT